MRRRLLGLVAVIIVAVAVALLWPAPAEVAQTTTTPPQASRVPDWLEQLARSPRPSAVSTPRCVRVSVADADGQPAAGARIRAWTGDDVADEALADTDGTAQLHVSSENARLTAQLDRRRAAGSAPTGPCDSPPSTHLVLARGAEITVRVLHGKTRQPIVAASVTLLDPDGPGDHATTSAQGEALLLRPLTIDYSLRVRAPGYQDVTLENGRRKLFNDDIPIVVYLSPAARLQGTVVDLAGSPVGDARVHVVCDVPSTRRPQSATIDSPAVSRADGTWETTVTESACRLTAVHAQHGPSDVITVQAPAEPITLQLGGARRVQGRVVDGAGRPVPGATVTAGSEHCQRSPPSITTTDDEGRFALTMGQASAVQRALYATQATTIPFGEKRDRTYAVAWRDGFASAPVRIPDEGDTTEDLVLTLTSVRVRGQLHGAANVAGWEVVLFPFDGPQADCRPPTPALHTNVDGTFTGAGWLPGAYAVAVRPPGKRELQPPVSPRERVQLEDGDNTLEVVVAEVGTGSITGRITDERGAPLSRVTVMILPEDRRSAPLHTLLDVGAFEVRDVPAGDTRVIFHAVGAYRESRDVRVTAGEAADVGTVVLEHQRTGLFHVVNADGDPVPTATLHVARALAPPDGLSVHRANPDELVELRDEPFRVVAWEPSVGASPVLEIPAGTDDVRATLTLSIAPGVLRLRVLNRRAEGVTVTLDATDATVQAWPARLEVAPGALGEGTYPLIPGAYALEVRDGEGKPVSPVEPFEIRAAQQLSKQLTVE